LGREPQSGYCRGVETVRKKYISYTAERVPEPIDLEKPAGGYDFTAWKSQAYIPAFGRDFAVISSLGRDATLGVVERKILRERFEHELECELAKTAHDWNAINAIASGKLAQ